MLAMVTNWVDRRPSILQPAQPAAYWDPKRAQWNLSIGVTDVGFCTTAARKNAVLSVSLEGPSAIPVDMPGYANGFQKFHREEHSVAVAEALDLPNMSINSGPPIPEMLAYLLLTRGQRDARRPFNSSN